MWVRPPPGAVSNFGFRNADFGLSQRLEPAKQIFFACDTGDLIAQLAVFEKEQGRDGANVVLERKTLTLVHINLGDLDHADLFARNLVQ